MMDVIVIVLEKDGTGKKFMVYKKRGKRVEQEKSSIEQQYFVLLLFLELEFLLKCVKVYCIQ